MSDFIPKPGSVRIGGLGRKAQKLLAAREKAERMKSGEKPHADAQATSFNAKGSFPTKKVNFQRKAV